MEGGEGSVDTRRWLRTDYPVGVIFGGVVFWIDVCCIRAMQNRAREFKDRMQKCGAMFVHTLYIADRVDIDSQRARIVRW